MARLTIRLKPSAFVEGKVEELSKTAVRRAARRTASRANINVIRKDRVDTGRLAKSFVTREVSTTVPGIHKVRVYSRAPYAVYQERGTRAHGPKRAKFMRFKPKGSNVYVFAKWVRGVPPGNFLRDAKRALTREDFLP